MMTTSRPLWLNSLFICRFKLVDCYLFPWKLDVVQIAKFTVFIWVQSSENHSLCDTDGMLLKQFMSIFSSKKNAIVKDVYIFLVSVLEHHSILLTCTCFTLARACNSVKWTMSATMDVHALNVVFYKAREISQQGLVKLITCMQF